MVYLFTSHLCILSKHRFIISCPNRFPVVFPSIFNLFIMYCYIAKQNEYR